jgi:hypothetical protein
MDVLFEDVGDAREAEVDGGGNTNLEDDMAEAVILEEELSEARKERRRKYAEDISRPVADINKVTVGKASKVFEKKEGSIYIAGLRPDTGKRPIRPVDVELEGKWTRKKPTKKQQKAGELGSYKLDKEGQRILSKEYKEKMYKGGLKWDERYIKEIVSGTRSRGVPTQQVERKVGESILRQQAVKTAGYREEEDARGNPIEIWDTEGDNLRVRWKDWKTGDFRTEFMNIHELKVLKASGTIQEERPRP